MFPCPVPGNLGLGLRFSIKDFREHMAFEKLRLWEEPQSLGPSWRHRGERGDGSGSTGERRSLGLEGIIKWES